MRPHLRLYILLLLAAISILFYACRKDKAISPESCSATNYSFQNDIYPIIQTNCAIDGCHGTNPNAPFTMLSYGGVDTAVHIYGLLRAIKHEGPNPMPRIDPFQINANKLPDSTIRKIECWINQGALNN